MFTIHSMTEVTLWIILTTFVLLLVVLRTNPFGVVSAFVQELLSSRKFLLHFAAVISIIFANKIQLLIERAIPHKTDLTPKIYRLEGDFVAGVQHLFRNEWLTALSTYYYVVVFTALLAVSMGVYLHQRNYRLFYAFCYAVILNYMVAIPFYLFFPVNEVWAFHPHVEMLMHEIFPTFEQEYRSLSGLNNCFPSLHTSLSVTVVLIARRSGLRTWKWFTAFSASFIIFSIFYLGIHWLTDMLGGVLLAVCASHLAVRLAEGRTPVRYYTGAGTAYKR